MKVYAMLGGSVRALEMEVVGGGFDAQVEEVDAEPDGDGDEYQDEGN